MSFVKTKDGVEIYYKDWGKGQPIVFSHGWPLSGDDWDKPDAVLPQAGLSRDCPRSPRPRPLQSGVRWSRPRPTLTILPP